MRSAVLVSCFVWMSCASSASESPRAASTIAAPAGAIPTHTSIDAADLAIDLAGTWHEQAVDDGYDLRGDHEEVIIGLFPVLDGNADASVEKLADTQRGVLGSICKRDPAVEPAAPSSPGQPIWSYATCADPRVAFVFVSSAAGGKIVSYEHYRYAAAAVTAAMKREDEAAFGSLRVKATSACPASVLAGQQSGTCLDAAVRGADAVAAGGHELESRGWVKDDYAAAEIGKQSGKRLVCYGRP